MIIQPFGYRVDLLSPLPPRDAKTAIRRERKSWFARGNGARGWILGPLLCLWWNPWDRSGPMLVAWMSQDSLGTRIRGRAGSDLNGVAFYIALLPLMAFFAFEMFKTGTLSLNQTLVLGAIFLCTPFMLWWNHKERHQADPLVRFVAKTLDVRSTLPTRRSSAR